LARLAASEASAAQASAAALAWLEVGESNLAGGQWKKEL